MSGNKVLIQLYRSLLYFGNRFDSIPASKSLLFRRNTLGNHESKEEKLSLYYNRVVKKVFHSESAIFLYPSKKSESFRSIIQREFRTTDEECGFNTLERIDVAFILLRKLSSIWDSFAVHMGVDENIVKGQLTPPPDMQRFHIDMASSLSPGLILVSHPLLPGCLHRSVILLLEHSLRGSYGVIINRHFPSSIASVIKNLPPSFLKIFGSNHVFFGGRERRFQVIHDVPDCGGIPIPNCSKPLFAGANIGQLISHCEINGIDQKDRFHFYAGCCYWVNDDLTKEIDARCWIPVTSMPNLLLDFEWLKASNGGKVDASLRESNGVTSILPSIEINGKIDSLLGKIDINDGGLGHENNDLWVKILEALGPDYSSFGDLPTWPDINNVESMDLQ